VTALTAERVVAMMMLTAERLHAAAAELSRLDAAAGDGDHGANMARASSAAEAHLRAETPKTPTEVFQVVGRIWAETGGGAAGALFGTLFDAIGQRLMGPDGTASELIDGLDAGRSAIEDIGHAHVGDRSLIDALAPGIAAAREALRTSSDVTTVLKAAAAAAESGAAATAAMPAKVGRAKYSPERAVGTPDPGAVTMSIVLAAWADAAGVDSAGLSEPRRGEVGLDRLTTPEGQFAILALDHVRSFAATMRPDDPDSMSHESMWAWKSRLMAGLGRDASAVLIDPAFAARRGDRAPWPTIGLIIGLEDSDYGAMQATPRLVPGWTAERAARLGADAIKVSFLFDPDEDGSATQRFVSDLVIECALSGLALLCEPLASPVAAQDMRRTVVEAVRRFGDLGVDVLKVQFPVDIDRETSRAAWEDGCAEVDGASNVPWALLSEGRDFDQFRELLTVACEAGASGFVAGRAIWGIAVDHPDAIRESASRLDSLRAIAKIRGRPWRLRQHEFTPVAGTERGAARAEANPEEVDPYHALPLNPRSPERTALRAREEDQ
jgi:tagatose 1,6-diphosphate aldolase